MNVHLNQLYKSVKLQRELWNAVAAFKSFILLFKLFSTSHNLSIPSSPFGCFSFAVRVFVAASLQPLLLMDVRFGSFGSVQAASGSYLMYNNQAECSHTCKSARLCESVCLHIPNRPIDPQNSCPPGQRAYQAKVRHMSICTSAGDQC